MAQSSVLWSAADELIDRARSPADLRAHRLHLLAAARFRALGRPVPEELIVAERRAAIITLAVPAVLQRARAAYDGLLMVMKGPEVALHYPDPTLRPFKDVDLVADDADEAQRALLAAGFREFGGPDGSDPEHHLHPLAWPGLPLTVEVHRAPLWVKGLAPPPLREVFDAARPTGLGIAGIVAPAPAHHALLLAAHAWENEALWRVSDLIDVAAIIHGTDREAVRTMARRWGCQRVWRSTELAVDAALYGAPRSVALRTWARHLQDARERTVLESRAQRLAGPFWGLPAGAIPRGVLRASRAHFQRHNDEQWRAKLVRTGKVVRNAALPTSEHARRVGPSSSERIRATH